MSTKNENLTNPESCFNKAEDFEQMFILLGRDRASASTVRYWCTERLRLGLNVYEDDKIQMALKWADTVDGGES